MNNHGGICHSRTAFLRTFLLFLLLVADLGTLQRARAQNQNILWQNMQTGDTTTWYMNGVSWTGRWDYLQPNVPTAWQIVARGDFNHDGATDLLWQNTSTGDVSVWYMNGTQWTGNWDYIARGVSLAWKIVGTGDFNRDGKLDLVWQNQSTGDVSVWYMNGVTWTGNWDYLGKGIATSWKIVSVVDLNQDGQSDLVWQNSQTGDVSYWLMNGVRQVDTGQIARTIPLAWKIVGTGDFNNDGKTDFVWQNMQTGDVTVWYMNGVNWAGAWDYVAQGVPLQWHIACVATLPSPQVVPVAVTGFDTDVIFEKNGTTSATTFDDGGTAWIEDGVGQFAGLPKGLFTSRILNPVTGTMTQYQLQPFTANNVLLLTSAKAQGTLTLLSPRRFRTLSIAAASTNARFVAGYSTLTLNFTDGSSSPPITYYARDWWGEGQNNDPNRIFEAGRYRTTNVGSNIPLANVQIDTLFRNFNLYETTLDLANVEGADYTGRSIQSITFNLVEGAFHTGIYAVSGLALP